MAKVGIGVPVYNGARFLAVSLESLVRQTYDDIEFVISDNGSTDETEEICRSFAARDERIRYLRYEENQGASWNFANVLHESSGPYFKWATHDDLLTPTFVERCVETLDSAPDTVALVYPLTRIIDAEGNVVRDYPNNLDIRDPTPHKRLQHLVQHIVMSNPAFGLIRREVLRRTRLLDTFPSSDYVLMAELAMLGEFWEIPEFLFLRREHAGMSRLAHRSAEEAAEWFEPGSGEGRQRFEFSRVFAEHFRSIHRLPLGPRERLLCYGAYIRAGLRRHRRSIARELSGRSRPAGAPGRLGEGSDPSRPRPANHA